MKGSLLSEYLPRGILEDSIKGLSGRAPRRQRFVSSCVLFIPVLLPWVRKYSSRGTKSTARDHTGRGALELVQDFGYTWILGGGKSPGVSDISMPLRGVVTERWAAPEYTASEAVKELGKYLDT